MFITSARDSGSGRFALIIVPVLNEDMQSQ